MTKFNDSHFNILIVCHFPECGSIFLKKKKKKLPGHQKWGGVKISS